MSNAIYDKARAAFSAWAAAGLSAGINLDTDTIKMVGVTSAYVQNLATDQFLSTVGANTAGTPVTLAFASNAAGVYKTSTTPVFTLSSVTIAAWLIYKDTGSAATSPLIGRYDGLCSVTTAVLASTGSTAITVDPIPYALASGATLTFGAVTVTLTAPASVGARSLTVSATSGSIAQGVTATNAPISGANLPMVVGSTPTSVTVTPDVTNGMLKL
jgi:hypothetical protein